VEEIEQIFEKIYALHRVTGDAEVTLEANPDDLTIEKLDALSSTPINRLSIGVQSFATDDLQFMNRAHDAYMAERCIKDAQSKGFTNLTIDLIYGSTTTTHETWRQNVEKAIAFEIPHISCYCLTVEPNTALYHFVKSGKTLPLQEEHATIQFELLIKILEDAGYVHYEISNFGKPNHFAQHNSNYWKGVPYLGVGPSAHAYNGTSRQWNVAHNAKYLAALQSNILPYEEEILSSEQRYNEYVMIGLRTIWGCNLPELEAIGTVYKVHFLKEIALFIENKDVVVNGSHYALTKKGKFMADFIAMSLFW
jgi:oxygen-independent coproporphyrinogen-3 oxidase